MVLVGVLNQLVSEAHLIKNKSKNNYVFYINENEK